MNPILAFQNWYLNASPEKKKKALLISIGSLATLALMLTTGTSDPTSASGDSTPLFFIGVAVKLVAVLLLILGGAVILRRWYGNRLNHGTSRQMHLVETIRLSPKQALHVVEVGGKRFLIGATDQSISMLSTVEEPQVEPDPAALPTPAVNFGDLFTSIKNKATPSNPDNQS